MVRIQQSLLILAVSAPLLIGGPALGPRYFPDDPIQKMPPPVPVGRAFVHKINQPFDFLKNSFRWKPGPPVRADAINTVGDPPDSAWFTNRHGSHRLTRDELQRGPAQGPPPTPPFEVVGGKSEGITPGFRIKDTQGRLYFVKVDPHDNPELVTSADVIVARFLYAIGYNVPENDLVYAKLTDFKISEKAELTDAEGHHRKMSFRDFKELVKNVPHYADGSFRMMASRKVEGDSVGPFYYEDVRADDPNDTVPHENRRDLRGLFVFFAWLNNTDARAGNTYDVIVQENGVRFIKHYLIDFGSALGSDGDGPKDVRLGHRFMIATPQEALRSIFGLGVVPHSWEAADYPDAPAIGNFTANNFQPDKWKSDYPNRAFLSRLPDDDFWAAKQVAAFTYEDIHAIVEMARFSYPEVTEYLTATLAARRDRIAETFFSKVLPLDNFRVENSALRFDDLAVLYKSRGPLSYEVRWFRFDNMTGSRTSIAEQPSANLPAPVETAAPGAFFTAVITSPGSNLSPVTVTVRKTATGYRIVGCSRFELPRLGS